jgi:hypothetical protein
MDTSALIMLGLSGISKWSSKLMFAMGRHALIDLSIIFQLQPATKYISRLSEVDFDKLVAELSNLGIKVDDPENAYQRLIELRRAYEPFCVSMARIFDFPLPAFVSFETISDDWQKSSWDRVEHF